MNIGLKPGSSKAVKMQWQQKERVTAAKMKECYVLIDLEMTGLQIGNEQLLRNIFQFQRKLSIELRMTVEEPIQYIGN